MQNKTWLSAYLYYDNSQEVLLKNSIYPFIKILKDKNAFEQFFFIRYFDRGKHIRLRFKSSPDKIEKEIKPFLINYFSEYFKEYPSERTEPAWVKYLPEDRKWFPTNSIQFFDYEPEYERYGGPKGLEISEEHFQFCSETVLDIIDENEEWSYQKAMGISLQLIISLCYAYDMKDNVIVDFFQHFCNLMIATKIETFSEIDKKGDIYEMRDNVYKLYDEKYVKNKDFYHNFHKNLIEAIKNGEKFEEEWYNTWFNKNKLLANKLVAALDNGELIIREKFLENYTKGKEKIYRLFYILFSYMHMTYNRLGIENKDEILLCYIMKESIKELNK